MSQGKFGGGNGSAGNPYLVEDVMDLNAIRNNPTKCYKLTQSINLGVYPYNVDKGWLPIMNFSGQLDGDGHKIMNLYINRPTQDDIGLFATAHEATNSILTVKNLFLDNFNVIGRNHVGAVYGTVQVVETQTGQTEAYIENCKFAGKVNGANQVGGLIGYLNWTSTLNFALTALKNVVTKIDISIQSKGVNYGGLVGLGASFKQNVKFNYVVADNTFDRHANGIDTDLNPNFAESYFVMTNCFYNKESWVYGSTANGSTVANMSDRQKMTDFDKQLDEDGNLIWNFAKDQRAPELNLFLRKKHFIKCSKGYYIYDFEKKAWKKACDSFKTREKAFKLAMENLDKLDFSAWEDLKKLIPSGETAQIITLYESSDGTEYEAQTFDLAKDTVHTTNLKRTYDGLETKIFKKKISFTELNGDGKPVFGDTIVKISKGIIE